MTILDVHPSSDDIAKAVCHVFCVPRDLVLSNYKGRRVVAARRACVLLCYMLTRLNFDQMASAFNQYGGPRCGRLYDAGLRRYLRDPTYAALVERAHAQIRARKAGVA